MTHLCQDTAIVGTGGFVVAVSYVVGEDPIFTRLARILKWSAKLEVSSHEWCDATSFGTLWAMGSVGQATGEMTFAFDTELNQHVRIYEGGSFGLWLCASPTSWIVIPSGLINDMDFDVDVESSAIVGGRASFRSSGPYFDYTHVEASWGSQSFLRRSPLGRFGDGADEDFALLAQSIGSLPTPPGAPN